MASKPEFAEFFARLSADDAELKADLKSAETQVKASAEKMQGSLDSVGASAGNASQALGTLAKGAGAVGGAMGGAVGQGIAFTEMLGTLGLKLTAGVAGVAALAAAVVIYRKEISEAIIKTAEWAGLIEDITAKGARNDALAKDLEFRLKLAEQRSKVKSDLELSQERLDVAQKGGQAGLAEFDLQRQIDALHGNLLGDIRTDKVRKDIEDTLRNRLAIVKALEDEKKLKADMAEFDRETAAMVAERKRKEEELAKAQTIAAQQLLVGLGAARQSEFIDDPTLKRLAQLSEMMSDRDRAAARATPTAGFGGTFGLSRVTSAMSTIRAGDVLGQQTLTVQEQTKQIAADHRDIARETKRILDDIKLQGRMATGGGRSLVITGNP